MSSVELDQSICELRESCPNFLKVFSLRIPLKGRIMNVVVYIYLSSICDIFIYLFLFIYNFSL